MAQNIESFNPHPAIGLAGYKSAVADTYGPMQMLPRTDDPFVWSIRARPLGGVGISNIESSGGIRAQVQPGRAESSRERIILMLIEEGLMELEQTGPSRLTRYAYCDDQTLLMMNVGRALDIIQPGHIKILSVSFPTQLMRIYLPTIEHRCGIAYPAEKGMASVMRDLIRSSWREFGNMHRSERSCAPKLFVDMVRSVFLESEDYNKEKTIIEQHMERINTVIDEELHNPNLSPARIAQRLQISTSYLYSISRKSGNTIGKMIMERRLNHCRDMLADPAHSHRSITDIALSWGFQDSSHFSHRFSEKFGVSPKRFREIGSINDSSDTNGANLSITN